MLQARQPGNARMPADTRMWDIRSDNGSSWQMELTQESRQIVKVHCRTQVGHDQHESFACLTSNQHQQTNFRKESVRKYFA